MEEKAYGYRWVILVLTWLAAAAVYFSITQVAPLGKWVIPDLAITKASFGLLFSAPLLTFAIVAFFGGAVSDRYGPRLVASLGITLLAIAAFCRGFAAESYSSLLLLNLLIGVGIGFTLPNLPKLTADWFPPVQRGVATSVYSTGISLGSSIGIMLTIPVAMKIAAEWGNVFFVWGTLALIIAAAMWILCRNAPGYKRPDSSKKLFVKEVYQNKSLWIVAASFFWACWIFYTFIGWIPTIIVSKGASPALAGALGGMVPLFGLLANLFAPALSNKLRNRTKFIWGCYLLGAIVVAIMIFSPISWFWVLLALSGIMVNVPFVISVFMMPIDLMPRENAGAATGLLMTIGYFAALLGPWVVGRIWDVSQSITVVLASLIVTYIIAMIIALFIPEPFKKVDVSQQDMEEVNQIS